MPTNRVEQDEDVMIVLHSVGREQYGWMFRESQWTEVLLLIGRLAADQDCPFRWHDAAVVYQAIRKMVNHG